MLNVLSVVKQKGNFPNEFMDIYQELSTELNKCSRYCDIISSLPEKMTAGMLKFRKRRTVGGFADYETGSGVHFPELR